MYKVVRKLFAAYHPFWCWGFIFSLPCYLLSLMGFLRSGESDTADLPEQCSGGSHSGTSKGYGGMTLACLLEKAFPADGIPWVATVRILPN